jgi:PAS domain S-box-containing protein
MTATIDSVVFQTVASPVLVLDPLGRIIRLNPACERLGGRATEQVAGHDFTDLLCETPEKACAQFSFEQALAGQTPPPCEGEWITPGGARRFVAWTFSPVTGEEGAVEYVVATGVELTAQRAAEQSMRRLEELNRRVLEVVPAGVAAVDMDGHIHVANDIARDFLGLVFDEVRRVYVVSNFGGRTIREDGTEFPVDDYPISRCLRTGQSQAPRIVGVIRADGQTFWGLFAATPLRDSATNRQTGALIAFLDSTEFKRATDALRKSEEHFRAAFAQARVGMAMSDLKGCISQVNQAYCRMTGYAESELLGKHFLDITHPDDRAENGDVVRRLLAGEITAGTIEKRYVTPEGRCVWGLASINLARNATGAAENLVVLVQDITERKRTEDLLLESERRFRQLAEAIEGVFWMIDANTYDLLYVSPAYERLWGRSCQSLYDRPESFEGGIHPDDRVQVLSTIRPIPQTGFDVEYRVLRPDGSEIWVQDRAFPIRNERGEIVRLAGIAQDITDRKRTEQAVQAMNEHLERLVADRTAAAQEQSRILRSVLQSMGEAVIVAGADGQVILTNRAAAEIAGPPNPKPHSVESCAQPMFLFKSDGLTPYSGDELPLARAVRGQAVDQEEMLILRDDRPHGVWISATARPLLDESGQLAGGVLVARDMTERRRVDELLRISERHHRQAAEHNRLLVRELEHRVRNNLAGLLGLVAAMQERASDVKAFGRAMESRLRAMAHVQQMLSGSEWRALDLRQLIDSLHAAMSFLMPFPIELATGGPPVSIPPRRVLPLTLILAEWITNSCKYGAHSRPAGKVNISWNFCIPDQPDRVCLHWRESGGPIPHRPITPSLGYDLVHAFASRELGGACAMNFPQSGADHHLDFSCAE